MNVVDNKSALEKLKIGLPIIFQTDTLPAIGCFPEFSAVIYQIKKRKKNKPLILMGSSINELIDYVHESVREDFLNIASKYWPGPLTIIIPVSEGKKHTSTSYDLTLGLRIPNSQTAKSLLEVTGPLLTSSANVSGTSGSITAEGTSFELPNVDILGPIPWTICSGSASTIISWTKNGKWKLIRKGAVSFKAI